MWEYGGTLEQPSRHKKHWFLAMASETPPDRGLIMHVKRRPRVRNGADPAPTVRVMRPNPVGIMWAKIQRGDIIVETEEEFQKRMRMMAEAGEDITALGGKVEGSEAGKGKGK